MAVIEQEVANPPALEKAERVAPEPPDEGDARQQTAPEVLQIPASLMTEDQRDKIVRFLDEELRLAETERQPIMEKIARWRIAYAAHLEEEAKHWPIWNASNLTIPVIKEIVNTICAQIVMQCFTARPRYVLKELAAEWEKFIDELELFFDIASDRDLKLDKAGIPAVLECCKMGTSVLSVEEFVDVRNIYKYSADTKRVYKSPQIFADGPRVNHIPITRCWIRAAERDINDARWFATEHDFTWVQLVQMAHQKKIGHIDKLKAFLYQQAHNIAEDAQESLNEWEPAEHDKVQLFRIYLSWDIDKDGTLEELVLWYSRDARVVCSGQFGRYWHGKRPFVKLGYFPREHSFWDEGLCEMLEALQEGISDKHNKRADNAALANLKMILKRKMVKGLQPGDPLYTGKIVEVNDIWNDIREWQMAEIYPSTVAEEQIMRRYVENVSGHNDATAGSAMPVTRTTASAQLALLQEQAKRIDLTVRSVRGGLNEIGALAAGIYHQFGTHGKAIAWMGEKGRVVEAIFRLPRRVQEIGLALKATVPTSGANRQLKQESSIQKLQLVIQVYEKLWPFVQVLAPEAMGQVANGFVRSARRFLEDFLETSDTTDVDDLLAGIVVLEKVLPAAGDFGGMESFRRAAESAEIHDKLSGLENLLREASADRERSLGVSAGGGNGRRMAREERLPRGGGPGFRLGGPPTQG